MFNQNFKAIIVGGSVAGLTLAHTFEQARIDYILLEARDTISPQLGASIVIMPNGARILDQMGIYERMSEGIMEGMRRTFVWRSDGRLVSSNAWPKLVEERLGYQSGICERRIFLQAMFDHLKDKSKVNLKKKVTSIEHGDGDMTVKCEDGSEFRSDIVIGADGIHSRTRKEMQNYAQKTGPPGLMDKDKNSITSEYACYFGISSLIPSLIAGDSHTAMDIDHSSLLFIGQHDLPQWFFFFKLPQRYTGESNIPRFTKSEADAQIGKHANFHASKNVTIGNLMGNTKFLGCFSLEEANHEVWTYGRIVCLGDAIHKMTPNLGQGGNQAIESAAVLTNCLLEMLDAAERKKLERGELEKTLRRYQDLRQKRAKKFVDLSGILTRNDALATLRHTLRFLYFEPFSGEMLADIQTEIQITAPCLNFLPLPKRTEGHKLWLTGAHDGVPGPRL